MTDQTMPLQLWDDGPDWDHGPDFHQQEVTEQRRYEEERMGIIAKDSGGGDYELPPEGTHIARCYRIVDMGTQGTTWEGQTKHARKVMVAWELLGETRTKSDEPFVASKRYTLSLHEKAGLRKDLESWRGTKFTAEQLEGFDIVAILGKPCLLSVIHEERESKKYANVKSVMPIMAGMVVPKAELEPYFFSLNDFDQKIYDSLSDGLKNVIAASPEYQEAVGGGPPADPDSDLPF